MAEHVSEQSEYDLIVIGGGIVGLATAYEVLRRRRGRKVLLLEKEDGVARHQTGHNSGVIHSGIYYKPGSLKAEMCTRGNATMKAFCGEHGIAYESCGKLIVATEESELAGLRRLEERGVANGVPLRRLDGAGIRELEPNARGIGALRVESTGIVDFLAVSKKLAELIVKWGGEIRLGEEAKVIERGEDGKRRVTVPAAGGSYRARLAVNCGGLYADRLAKRSGMEMSSQIVPFRGEYYQLRPEKAHLVKGLIYPVPDPSFPFLGVHCTRMIDGTVHLGPNAVLAFKREGYRKLDFDAGEFWETITFPGLWKLFGRHAASGMGEMVRSVSRRLFVRSVQRLVPSIEMEDVLPCEAGVRAQALGRSGELIDDFLILEEPGMVHVCNAPSPAATASLEIGKAIADRVESQEG